jgi:hypothetical protein
MNNNLKIAEDYCIKVKKMTKKWWVSDNLPMLSAQDRRAILKVYKKHFHTVEYDPISGICKCWITEPESDTLQGSLLETLTIDLDNPHTRANRPISQATRDALGLKKPDLVVLDSINSNQL